jgi:hypothetical protein
MMRGCGTRKGGNVRARMGEPMLYQHATDGNGSKGRGVTWTKCCQRGWKWAAFQLTR